MFNDSAATNFGQTSFTYTPPSGFVALNTFNLPTPTIGTTATTQADDYFSPVLYTGNGTSQTISGLNFSPDLVWQKTRTGTGWNNLIDKVRGVGNRLFSNTTNAESFSAQSLTAFTSSGFSIGNDGDWNTNSSSNVAWCWKAAGSTVSNTAGSITSTVSVNTTAGFSVITYTGNGVAGATVGHGLGVTPAMIITKVRSTTESWPVFHKALLSLGTGYFLELDSTAAAGNGNSRYPSAPNSSVVTIGSAANLTPINANGQTYVMYAFAEVAGYSKFGSYTANGSTDGPFIYTGFKPKFVLVKATGGSQEWVVFDGTRSPYNAVNLYLLPNASNAEGTGNEIDFLSNGFKIRVDGGGLNYTPTNPYIYMAFAETPFNYSNAR
jgi:hypothetical protein